MKKISILTIAVVLALALAACGSNKPCADCGRTPTKGYKNDYTGETEYYCDRCAHDDCAFCSDQATRSMTVLGQVVFACDDCYNALRGD